MAVGQDAHLGIVRAEAHESEALRLAGLAVLFDLCHQHIAIALKVFPQTLLGGFPGETQHDEISAPQAGFDALCLCR